MTKNKPTDAAPSVADQIRGPAPPSVAQIRGAVIRARLDPSYVAHVLGVQARSVRRWIMGENPPPREFLDLVARENERLDTLARWIVAHGYAPSAPPGVAAHEVQRLIGAALAVAVGGEFGPVDWAADDDGAAYG